VKLIDKTELAAHFHRLLADRSNPLAIGQDRVELDVREMA
jgi:hypothetical protein